MKKKRRLLFILSLIMILGLSGCNHKELEIKDDSEIKEETKEVLVIETTEKENEELQQFEENKLVIENESLEIQNLSPYTGNDFQNGEFLKVSDVYAVKITNLTEDLIKDATLVFNDGNQELVFLISFLPAGESTIVIEAEQKKGSVENLIYVEGEIEYLSDAENAMDSVAIVFGEDRSVNVTNLTEETISLMWLICKPFNDQDETYGTPYIVAVDSLEDGGEQTIETELSEGNYQIVWAQRIE